MPFYLPPLAAALTVLSLSDAPLGAAAFMALAGITAGMSAVMVAAVWAELYGTRHLRAIRSMSVSIVVLATPPACSAGCSTGAAASTGSPRECWWRGC